MKIIILISVSFQVSSTLLKYFFAPLSMTSFACHVTSKSTCFCFSLSQMETSFSLSLRIAMDRRESATGGRERTTSQKENGRKREGTNSPSSSNMNPDALPSSLDPASVCTFPSLIPHTYISYIRIYSLTRGDLESMQLSYLHLNNLFIFGHACHFYSMARL